MNTETWKLSNNVPVNTLPDGGNINAAEPARIPEGSVLVKTIGNYDKAKGDNTAIARILEHNGSVYIDSWFAGASPCRYTVPGVTAQEWLNKWGYV